MENITLITGVSREEGLGYETARQLKEKDYKIIIMARVEEKTKALADKLGVASYPLDITDPDSISKLVQKISNDYGKLDVLINNAGAFFDMGSQPLDADMGFVKEAFDTNLLGAWRMIQAFVPLLKKSDNPRIVNVSSGAGSFKDPVFGLGVHQGIVPVYGITKLALNGLTVKMARQLTEDKVKVNAVCPGFVATYPGTEEWGARPVYEGAEGIVWAASIDKDGPTGQFFRDGKPLEW